ncbi:MAG: MBL fold metallo-hydrolase, partial [Clostridia bacterium]|nr:MBL fold metallo-hydrolase [Clostridia bacterium]
MNSFNPLPEWIKYAGVHDRDIDLFEGQYRVPHGMSYNSYCLLDSKTAVMDTVDRRFTHEWLDNVAEALGGRQPDYLVVQHMEPDHSANIRAFLNNYKNTVVVGNAKTFNMIKQFFGEDYADRRIVVADGDTLCLGAHTLSFVFAPMVHWPELMLTYEQSTGVLFSADACGR